MTTAGRGNGSLRSIAEPDPDIVVEYEAIVGESVARTRRRRVLATEPGRDSDVIACYARAFPTSPADDAADPAARPVGCRLEPCAVRAAARRPRTRVHRRGLPNHLRVDVLLDLRTGHRAGP